MAASGICSTCISKAPRKMAAFICPPVQLTAATARRITSATIWGREIMITWEPSTSVIVARQRRNHQVERVRCTRAMRCGIGQGLDNLELLDDRAGPTVRDDERQRMFMFRTHVNEMHVQPIDL